MEVTAGAAVPGALAIMFAAGVSEGVGTQLVVLFVNRVSRRNFGLNLLMSGVLYVLTGLLWATSIWLVVRLGLGVDVPVEGALRVAAAGSLPYLLGFLVLAPHAGLLIHRLLGVASFLFVLESMALTYGLQVWQALAAIATGWLVLQAALRVAGRPTAIVRRWMWQATTGRETRLDVEDLAAELSRARPDAR